MVKVILIVSFFLIFSCSKTKKEIALLGQWHLLSNQNTTDIEASKKLPQYMNQKAIYLIMNEWIENQKIDLLLSEGCEKVEIDKNFKSIFNGWNYTLLKSKVETQDFANILTLLPLKIETKFDEKIKVKCADSDELIKKHQLIFSDIKGHISFLTGLKVSKDDPPKFKLYKQKLEEINKAKIEDPIRFCKDKIKSLLAQERKQINLRNDTFIEQIKNSSESKIAVIIGYRHISELRKSLVKLGYKVTIPPIIKTTLPVDNLEENLLRSLDN